MAEQSESARLSSNLADIYGEQGRYLEAEALYQQAMVLCEQQGNIAIALMISPLQGLARAYLEQGRENEARQWFTRALFLSNTISRAREKPSRDQDVALLS